MDNIKDDLIEVLFEIEKRSKFKIKEVGIDKNHIHLLIKTPPTISISQIVRRIKSMSTNMLWKKKSEYLEKYYWKNRVLWTHGYFCSTVGEMSEETIITYIKKQG